MKDIYQIIEARNKLQQDLGTISVIKDDKRNILWNERDIEKC